MTLLKLTKIGADTGAVFPEEMLTRMKVESGDTLVAIEIEGGFRPVVKRLGLYYKGFGWHAFRRVNISYRQHYGGTTPLEAQRGGRQSSLDMTYLYTLSEYTVG